MYRDTDQRGVPGSRRTPEMIRADLQARRISAEHWLRQAHAATVAAQHLRDDFDKRRAEAEERSAALLAASVGNARNDATVRRLAFFDADFCVASDRTGMLTALIDAALALTRADFGNVQLVDDAAALRIAAHCGFETEFLDFFSVVHDQASACGLAAARGRKVTVPDVTSSPVFNGGPARQVVLGAGVRAVHSIPLTSRGGTLHGIMSVHYDRPRRPDFGEERLLDLLAAAASRRLDRSADEATIVEEATFTPTWLLERASSP